MLMMDKESEEESITFKVVFGGEGGCLFLWILLSSCLYSHPEVVTLLS